MISRIFDFTDTTVARRDGAASDVVALSEDADLDEAARGDRGQAVHALPGLPRAHRPHRRHRARVRRAQGGAARREDRA